MPTVTPVSATSAEIARNFGTWQDRVARQPVVVTHHGRRRCVLLSADLYDTIAAQLSSSDAAATALLEHEVLSERMDDGLVILDRDLAIVSSNASGALMLGRPREHLVGTSVFDLFPQVREGPIEAQLRRTLRTGEDSRFVLATPSYEFRVHAFCWPTGLAITLRRMVASDEVETAALEALSLRRALSCHDRVGLAEITVRGTFASIDAGFAAVTGFAAARLVGSRLVDILALSDRAAAIDAMERALTSREPVTFDAVLLAEGGAQRSVHVSLSALGEGVGARGLTLVTTPLPDLPAGA